MNRRARRTLLASLTALLAPTLLAAQQLRGTVRDSMSGLGVPGAVVSTLDAAGQPTLRTISDQAGEFVLDAPAGTRRLRVIRIGFSPHTVSVPAAGAPLDVRMLALPALLTRVHVSDRAICPGSDDRSGALALWDQARAGLLATVVARQTHPGQMRILGYATDRDPRSGVVVKQITQLTTGTSARPFVAVNKAAEFARSGYMERIPDGLNFFAPDADVLLDPTFAATHCFHIARDDDHPGQVGLGFTPAPDARNPDDFVDVRGTLWIESDHPELRTLDFRYTGLASAFEDAGAGGRLVFRTLPNGLSLIERWHMNLPSFEATVPAAFPRLPSDRQSRGWPTQEPERTVRLTHWHDTGGEVLAAQWPDGSRLEPSIGAVTGTVRDATGAPLAGVRVSLNETPDSARTDSTGRFILWPVIPGRYDLSAVDSTDAKHAASRTTTVTVARDTLNVGVLALPR
ncbi:MAG: carboxypeptidase regulatory-like domain-containing protein [Gemmatimonadota bacterium]|nr:carboxypeptidase regulatory-like domain-containing protein [Gemmatimonadota bacterium]